LSGVTAEQYETARSEGNARRLFQVRRPGIKLFDDFDLGVRQRDSAGHTHSQSTFYQESQTRTCRAEPDHV
jgi:hypothetical protein